MEEVWKDVIGYEGLYQVSNLGRVKSLDKKVKCRNQNIALKKGQLLKSHFQEYERVSLHKGATKLTKKIHRLVAEAFIPNPLSKRQVNHIDGDKRNNAVDNLEWCTAQENSIHSRSVLKKCVGQRNGQAKLTDIHVRIIREALSMNYTNASIARYFKVHPSIISVIKLKQGWNSIK